MVETKTKEATIYNQLADMVDDMSPTVIQETIIQTPKPGTNIPPEADARSHKSRATVDYTAIGVEPHEPTRGV